jgi:AAA domain
MGKMMNKEQGRQYLDDLKRRVGNEPFTSRITFTNGKAPCPAHGGDAGFTLFERDGMWFGKCHSACNKTWDAIGIVELIDKVDFKTAVARLGGRAGNKHGGTPTDKPKPRAITDAEWQQWGHEVTAEDIAEFADSRKDKTASVDAWRALGCRVKDGALGFPYRLGLENGETKYFTIKTRDLASKEIKHEHCTNSQSLFNLDSVNYIEPIYVVEGEPDVAIMEEAGFRAVSVMNANHNKFDKAQLAILCEASYIFLMGDQSQRGIDDPGGNCMDALESQLPVGKVSRIRFSDAKDACELASRWGDGFANRVQELSDDARTPWVSKNIGNVTELLKLPNPRWLVDRMIPYGGVTIFCSPQGGQKTTMALALSRAISNPSAFGNQFLGRDIVPHARRMTKDGFMIGSYGASGLPVLYIDRENPPAEIGSRLRRMGLLASRDFLYWGDGDPNAAKDTPDVTDRRLEEWIKQTGGLIIFDSLQDWYGDAKEIDNSAMVKLMHGFRRLARLGAGIVILHHVAKGQGRDPLEDMRSFYRGGTGIVSIPEMAIGLVKDEHADVLKMGEIRFRMCPTWEITAKLDWEAPKWDGSNHGIALSLIEDLDWKELRARRNGYQEEKKAAKVEQMKEEAASLVAAVEKNPEASSRELEDLTGVNKNRVTKLLAFVGWRKIGGKWVAEDQRPN